MFPLPAWLRQCLSLQNLVFALRIHPASKVIELTKDHHNLPELFQVRATNRKWPFPTNTLAHSGRFLRATTRVE